ncbi:hypothetical protein H7097_03100 [Aeromicrobium sp.]|nr:hypothetical protein [Candidatus Saccharibacteria bacterium]
MEEPKKMNSMAAIAAVVALVVGLGVGFGVTKAMDNGNESDSMTKTASAAAPSSATKSADLRSTLVKYGVEHMILTQAAVADALDGSPGAAASGAALYSNGTDIGAAVGSVYGKDAETTFNTVWKLHLDEFVKYAVAGKTGDAAGKTAALDSINTNYTKPLAAYLAKANPNLPEATLEGALNDHVLMTAKMIDFHVAGNYAEEQKELNMANDHIEGLFSTLAGGIVTQFPAKF